MIYDYDIVVSLVGRLGLNGFAEKFIDGMANLAGGALVVGFARAILVVMTEGHILDTILYSTSGAVFQLPSTLATLGIYIFQCFFNYLVPSGSGQAIEKPTFQGRFFNILHMLCDF